VSFPLPFIGLSQISRLVLRVPFSAALPGMRSALGCGAAGFRGNTDKRYLVELEREMADRTEERR